jgi:hypothetical protein
MVVRAGGAEIVQELRLFGISLREGECRDLLANNVAERAKHRLESSLPKTLYRGQVFGFKGPDRRAND